MSTATIAKLDQASFDTLGLLQFFVQARNFRLSPLGLAFGTRINRQSFRELQQKLKQGGLSGLPEFEIHTQAKLGRTREAYVGAIDRILLAQEFLASASQSQIVAVLEEALGHTIDARIYTVDIVRQKHIEIFS